MGEILQPSLRGGPTRVKSDRRGESKRSHCSTSAGQVQSWPMQAMGNQVGVISKVQPAAAAHHVYWLHGVLWPSTFCAAVVVPIGQPGSKTCGSAGNGAFTNEPPTIRIRDSLGDAAQATPAAVRPPPTSPSEFLAQPLDPSSQPGQARPHSRGATAPQSLRRSHRPASAATQPRRPARAQSGQQPGSAGAHEEVWAAGEGQPQGQPPSSLVHLQLSQQPGSAAAIAQLWADQDVSGAQTQGQPVSSLPADAPAPVLAGAEVPPQMGRPTTAVPQRRNASRPGSAPAARRQKVGCTLCAFGSSLLCLCNSASA